MVRLGLARQTRRVPKGSILLHPYAREVLLPSSHRTPICALDCSWRRAAEQFAVYEKGRHLPPLLAGNPVNYARIGMLSTAEAVAAALYITGKHEKASLILGKFRWGHTFLDLNKNILEEYAGARTQQDMSGIAASYGLAAPVD